MARLIQAFKHISRLPEVWSCIRHCRQPGAILRRYLAIGRPDYPFHFALKSNVDIVVHDYHDLVTAWIIFLRDEYLIQSDAKWAIDIGANIGCFSLRCVSTIPAVQLIAVEPFPSTYSRLVANIATNGFANRVRCWQVGIAAQSGVRTMGASGPSQSRGLLPPEGRQGEFEVNVFSFQQLLENVCAELQTEEIDFVKLDVEGGEHETLLASPPHVLRRIRRLGMEYHPNRPKGPLFDHLTGIGFQLEQDQKFGQNVGVAHFARR
jgi:FkbM family methyltransferase